jgi:SanA protein
MNRWVKPLVVLTVMSILLVVLTVAFANGAMFLLTRDSYLANVDDASQIECILILGAGVWGDAPSPMLRERLDQGILLFHQGVSPRLLMSGDHHQKGYNEVEVMLNYALERGVPKEAIFLDHAGLSTYDSMARAKHIFGVERLVVVTQGYHLPRALYLARMIGIDALGSRPDEVRYGDQWRRDVREVLARTKDFFVGMIQPSSYIDGPQIDITGPGE